MKDCFTPLDAALTTACPPPSVVEATAFAAACFGLEGEAEPLAGERDANFRVTLPDGRAYVLKIVNSAETPAVIHMQIAALRHLARAEPTLPLHCVIPTREGEDVALYSDGSTPSRLAWMVTYHPGRVLASVASRVELREDVGRCLGRVTRGLAGFSHDAASRHLLWDVAEAGRLLPLVGHLSEPALRQRVEDIFTRFTAEIAGQLRDLPHQIVHADFNSHNLIVSDDGLRISGILDFGDMVRTARVADLAVALSYHMGREGNPWEDARDVLAAYQDIISLTQAELAILPALIETRLAMSVVISEWRAVLYPENREYILRNNSAARQRLAIFRGCPDHG